MSRFSAPWIIAVALFWACLQAPAQLPLPFNRERTAMQKMADRQWYQARELLNTALRKDPSSAEGTYAMAVYFHSPANPRWRARRAVSRPMPP